MHSIWACRVKALEEYARFIPPGMEKMTMKGRLCQPRKTIPRNALNHPSKKAKSRGPRRNPKKSLNANWHGHTIPWSTQKTATMRMSGLLDKLNPFQVGKNLRKSLDSAITSLARVSGAAGVSSLDGQRSIYYLDDRFQDSGGALFTQESNPYLSRLAKEDYIPEVLVVGATGEVGRLVVRRLLLEGRCRCRCLVSDLYSRTLNMLGTGVVYCQGDLSNLDSLEYALTDVDKIVVCEGAPRSDDEGGGGEDLSREVSRFCARQPRRKCLGQDCV